MWLSDSNLNPFLRPFIYLFCRAVSRHDLSRQLVDSWTIVGRFQEVLNIRLTGFPYQPYTCRKEH